VARIPRNERGIQSCGRLGLLPLLLPTLGRKNAGGEKRGINRRRLSRAFISCAKFSLRQSKKLESILS
jgi:hypothetical protein